MHQGSRQGLLLLTAWQCLLALMHGAGRRLCYHTSHAAYRPCHAVHIADATQHDCSTDAALQLQQSMQSAWHQQAWEHLQTVAARSPIISIRHLAARVPALQDLTALTSTAWIHRNLTACYVPAILHLAHICSKLSSVIQDFMTGLMAPSLYS